jgi:hypothetical protein
MLSFVLVIAPGLALDRSTGETDRWQDDRAQRGGPEVAAHPRDAPTTTD